MIWNKIEMLGIAKIEAIDESFASKVRHRCPICGSTKIKERLSKAPRYRCACREVFGDPDHETIQITKYEATFKETWVTLKNTLSADGCRKLSSTPKSQHSIRPLDKSKVRTYLRSIPLTR